MKCNEEIRAALKRCNMRQWQLADLLGVHETTMTVRLRHELPTNEKERIIRLIESATKGMEGENE